MQVVFALLEDAWHAGRGKGTVILFPAGVSPARCGWPTEVCFRGSEVCGSNC